MIPACYVLSALHTSHYTSSSVLGLQCVTMQRRSSKVTHQMHGIITGKLNEACNRETCWCLKKICPVSETVKIIIIQRMLSPRKKTLQYFKDKYDNGYFFFIVQGRQNDMTGMFHCNQLGFHLCELPFDFKKQPNAPNLSEILMPYFREIEIFLFHIFTFQLEILLANPQNAAII